MVWNRERYLTVLWQDGDNSGESEATNQRIKTLFTTLQEGGKGARKRAETQSIDMMDLLVRLLRDECTLA